MATQIGRMGRPLFWLALMAFILAPCACFLVLAVSLPVLGVAAVGGLIVAAFQAASQIQDPTLAHLPRLLAVIVAVALLGPWMGHEVATFAMQMFSAH